MYFFTSDLHLSHDKIRIYCQRPFKDVEQMNTTIINNWNERVRDNDTVFHIGDFCFKSPNSENSFLLTRRLKGNKIFIAGNHDKNNSLNTKISRLYLYMAGKDICCVHKPIHADLNVPLNLVGHVHEKWMVKVIENSILFNVGVDQHNFRPITYNEIERIISKMRHSGLL
jgi:calcineurin-like phosphoesterase family protein